MIIYNIYLTRMNSNGAEALLKVFFKKNIYYYYYIIIVVVVFSCLILFNRFIYFHRSHLHHILPDHI